VSCSGRSLSFTFFSTGAFYRASPCLPSTPWCSLAASRVALGCNPREDLRANEVHQSLLGPIPKYTRLPVAGLLMAILTVCQILKLSASFGIGYGLPGNF
jgi:hypothetical protein